MNEISEDKLFAELKKHFGFDKFKSDTQRKAIDSVLRGEKNVYVSMPTGSGKSLCYLLPGVLQENKLVIVISPLIALMKNQLDYLRSRKIKAETLNSSQATKEREAVLSDLNSVKTVTKFLYITPEQANSKGFKLELLPKLVKFDKISLFAVDEAHCVSTWGHDFRKDYPKLGELRQQYPSMQWIALTATAPENVRKDVLKQLNFKNPKIFQVSCFRKNLYYDIVYKNMMENEFPELKSYIEECLKENEENDLKGSERACGIIYCRKKETTEIVANCLRKLGLNCRAFHAGLKQSEKIAVQNDWMNGKIPVISATVAFGMGIDKASVRFVIHWDVAQNIAAYYQESGRAGRDGKKSYCRLYFDRADSRAIDFILNQELGKHHDTKSPQYLRAKQSRNEFEKIVNHCENVSCRHLLFTKYFGDPPPTCQAMCDVCKDKRKCNKQFEVYQQICATAGGTIEQDYDPNDFYEGGRQGNFKKGSFEDYDDDSGDNSSYYRERKERKEERDFLNKQFAIRKANAAASMEMTVSAKISRVKSASATERKVSGLTISKRDQNVTNLVSILKTNLDMCAQKLPPEYPKHKLNGEDIEQVAILTEYEAFENTKAISVYNSRFGKIYYSIKNNYNKMDSPVLFPALLNYEPQKRQAHGGDYETIVNDLKDRYGEDVVNELESEKQKDKKEKSEMSAVEKRVKKNSARHNTLNQTNLLSFFNRKDCANEINPPASEDFSPNRDENSLDNSNGENNQCEKPIENGQAIKSEDAASEEMECERNGLKVEHIEVAPVNVEKPSIKRKIETFLESQDEAPPPTKKSREEVEAVNIEKPSIKRKVDSQEEEEAQPSMKKSREDLNEDSRELKKEHDKNLIRTSKLVVQCLNPQYSAKKFVGPNRKELFKQVAKKITHSFVERNPHAVPSQREVERHIAAIFEEHENISSEEQINDL